MPEQLVLARYGDIVTEGAHAAHSFMKILKLPAKVTTQLLNNFK